MCAFVTHYQDLCFYPRWFHHQVHSEVGLETLDGSLGTSDVTNRVKTNASTICKVSRRCRRHLGVASWFELFPAVFYGSDLITPLCVLLHLNDFRFGFFSDNTQDPVRLGQVKALHKAKEHQSVCLGYVQTKLNRNYYLFHGQNGLFIKRTNQNRS